MVAQRSPSSRRNREPLMASFAGGWFSMGSDDGAPAESPQHQRHVAPFEIDRSLVTNSDFGAFVDQTGYRTTAETVGAAWGFDGERFGDVPGLNWRSYATAARQTHPVVLVSWHDAAAFASWADKRLPTEAEWEFVARLAACGAVFPWDDGGDPFEHCGAGRTWGDGPGTSPVGRYGSRVGVDDLVGNVWQWCSDHYSGSAYADYTLNASEAPIGDRGGEDLRVRRGGAWNVMQAFRLRCANRGAYLADRPAPNLGFRCAR